MAERDYWIAWSGCPHIGPVRFEQMLNIFGSAQAAWEATVDDLTVAGIQGKLIETITQYREKFDFPEIEHSLKRWHITPILKNEPAYPESLRQIAQAPLILYAMGGKNSESRSSPRVEAGHNSGDFNLNPYIHKPLVAVVGTRKITAYGRQVTQRLVNDLVASGVGIVSGLMYGVDEVAHRSCIESGGTTIGIWAGGLDSLFHGSRQTLAELILQHDGLLLSEYPVGLPPSTHTFPYRNRIVAGLSRGVVVTEGSLGSGTLITAGYAAEQGKEVFAVPGPITSEQAQAPLQLIKSGARLITSAADVLEELNITHRSANSYKKFEPQNMSKDEQKIIEHLSSESLTADELARLLALSIAQLGATLSVMEIKGWLKSEGDRWRIN